VRLGDVDLLHVPLCAPQGLGGRVARGLDRGGVDGLDRLVVDERRAEPVGRGDGLDARAGDWPANAVFVDVATSTPIWS
jgi:hypothetical protein